MADTLRFYLMLSLIAQLALSQPCCTMLILWPSLVCAEGAECTLPVAEGCVVSGGGSCGGPGSGCGSSPLSATPTPCGDPEPGPPLDRPCDTPDAPPCDDDDCDTCPPAVPRKAPGEKPVTLNLPPAVVALYAIDLPRPARNAAFEHPEPHPPPTNQERRARLGVWLN